MSGKKTTKTSQTNTLPDWLTSPYQAATTQASTLAQQPAVSSGTQGAINRTMNDAAGISAFGNAAAGGLSSLASGSFGANSGALTGAANGSFVSSNPFANGSATNPFAATGNRAPVSGALSGFQANGGLDRGYIDASGLNKTAAGDYLTADSNPYIRGVAQQGADSAQAAINGQFGAAGRSNGSGLYAQLFGQGIADATNSVYAQNYANERQLQQGAQSTLLGADQSAREAALSRQYGAAGNVFGAENAANEAALGRQYGATEASLGRQASSYEAERARQQAAAGGLLDTQLSAYGQLPGLLSSISAGNAQAIGAGQYMDQAGLDRLQQSTGILTGLASPFTISNGTTTEKTSGLGASLGSIANLVNAGVGAYSAATGAGAFRR